MYVAEQVILLFVVDAWNFAVNGARSRVPEESESRKYDFQAHPTASNVPGFPMEKFEFFKFTKDLQGKMSVLDYIVYYWSDDETARYKALAHSLMEVTAGARRVEISETAKEYDQLKASYQEIKKHLSEIDEAYRSRVEQFLKVGIVEFIVRSRSICYSSHGISSTNATVLYDRKAIENLKI